MTKFILIRFSPFLVMLVGFLVAMVGGYRGYEVNWRNGWQATGLVLIILGIAVVLVYFVAVIWRWIKNWVNRDIRNH